MTRLILLTLLMPLLSMRGLAAPSLTGTWTFEWKPDLSGHEHAEDCRLTQEGHRLSIDCERANGTVIVGEVNGRKVTFQHKTGKDNELTVAYRVTLDRQSTTMTGTWHLSPENREGQFAARRRQGK